MPFCLVTHVYFCLAEAASVGIDGTLQCYSDCDLQTSGIGTTWVDMPMLEPYMRPSDLEFLQVGPRNLYSKKILR